MGPRIRKLGVPVATLGLKRGVPFLTAVWRLRQIIHEVKPSIIQGWMYHGNLAAWLGGRFASNTPAIFWNVRQSLYDLRDEKPLTRQVIRVNRLLSSRTDAIIYNSRLSKKQHEAFGFAHAHGIVIPNGIDLERFRFSVDARSRIRADLNIPQDALLVGHVARYHLMKNHAGFLEAAVRVAERIPKTQFVLAGKDVTRENRNLSGVIPRHLTQRFHLLGERKDIPELMSAMDIFCLSSEAEAFPNVLLEAMACGVPCVTTDVGDAAYIIGDIGLVVPPRNIAALADGMERLLSMPEAERRNLGTIARERIVQNFSLGKMVEKYEKVLSFRF